MPFLARDLVAHQRFVVAPDAPDSWSERTIAYEDVLTADEKQIQRWFDRKSILIGQMRPGNDEHIIWGNKKIYGCVVQAEALDSLLLSLSEPRVFLGGTAPYALLWCSAAALLASVTRPRRWTGTRLLAWACVGLAFLGVLAAAYAALTMLDLWKLQLAIALSAMLLAGSLSYWAKAYREWQLQLAPASIKYTGEPEQLPSTILAPQPK